MQWTQIHIFQWVNLEFHVNAGYVHVRNSDSYFHKIQVEFYVVAGNIHARNSDSYFSMSKPWISCDCRLCSCKELIFILFTSNKLNFVWFQAQFMQWTHIHIIQLINLEFQLIAGNVHARNSDSYFSVSKPWISCDCR